MSDEKPRAWHSVLAASLTVIGVGVALAALYVLSLGMISIVVGGGLFLLVGLHYVVWGWWLGPAIHRDVEAEEDEQAGR